MGGRDKSKRRRVHNAAAAKVKSSPFGKGASAMFGILVDSGQQMTWIVVQMGLVGLGGGKSASTVVSLIPVQK